MNKHCILPVFLTFVFTCLSLQPAWAQIGYRDSAVFVEPKNEFLEHIKKESEEFRKQTVPAKKELRVDFTKITSPGQISDFTSVWRNPPVSQGISGMCWCFSTTSFFESEVQRLYGKKLKLSELFTVYWEYVEKARRFVRERGNSLFSQGSEANAVPRIWHLYGIVPESTYTGLLPGQTFHDHTAMFQEMNVYLESVRTSNAWDEDAVVNTIKAILGRYLGEPPASFEIDGKTMTPKQYLHSVVRLNLDDYVDVLSLEEKPFHQYVEYVTPDNWWHSAEYYNVPLSEFIAVIKKAIRKGYSLALGGDTSEPGYDGHAGIAVIPTFDIPSDYINDDARQYRFSNGSTGDDHGIHLVGYSEKGGSDWYLIKDSGSGSRNNNHPGYYFYREDYVKLKMVDLMVHKDAVRSVISDFAK
jgi:bleomycin hydrolase